MLHPSWKGDRRFAASAKVGEGPQRSGSRPGSTLEGPQHHLCVGGKGAETPWSYAKAPPPSRRRHCSHWFKSAPHRTCAEPPPPSVLGPALIAAALSPFLRQSPAIFASTQAGSGCRKPSLALPQGPRTSLRKTPPPSLPGQTCFPTPAPVLEGACSIQSIPKC